LTKNDERGELSLLTLEDRRQSAVDDFAGVVLGSENQWIGDFMLKKRIVREFLHILGYDCDSS